jgi:hypothetical protein
MYKSAIVEGRTFTLHIITNDTNESDTIELSGV